MKSPSTERRTPSKPPLLPPTRCPRRRSPLASGPRSQYHPSTRLGIARGEVRWSYVCIATELDRRGIRPRFGAVQQHGSISVIERFIRSMTNECTRRILVPLALEAMRSELTVYLAWFDEHRPSQALGNKLIDGVPEPQTGPIKRRERLGGLLNSYYREAA